VQEEVRQQEQKPLYVEPPRNNNFPSKDAQVDLIKKVVTKVKANQQAKA
jgi:hypothetical protein